jgi:hypothetical protein
MVRRFKPHRLSLFSLELHGLRAGTNPRIREIAIVPDDHQGEVVFARADTGKILSGTKGGEKYVRCGRPANTSTGFYQTFYAEFLSPDVAALDDSIRITDQSVAGSQDDATGCERRHRNRAKHRAACVKRFNAAIVAQDSGGRLAGVRVDKFTVPHIEPAKKERHHRGLGPHLPEFSIDDRHSLGWVET